MRSAIDLSVITQVQYQPAKTGCVHVLIERGLLPATVFSFDHAADADEFYQGVVRLWHSFKGYTGEPFKA